MNINGRHINTFSTFQMIASAADGGSVQKHAEYIINNNSKQQALTIDVQLDAGLERFGQIAVVRAALESRVQVVALQPADDQHVLHGAVRRGRVRLVDQRVVQPPRDARFRPTCDDTTNNIDNN